MTLILWLMTIQNVLFQSPKSIKYSSLACTLLHVALPVHEEFKFAVCLCFCPNHKTHLTELQKQRRCHFIIKEIALP